MQSLNLQKLELEKRIDEIRSKNIKVDLEEGNKLNDEKSKLEESIRSKENSLNEIYKRLYSIKTDISNSENKIEKSKKENLKI